MSPAPAPALTHFTRASSNTKTGPIPVSTSSRTTCPPSCSFKGNGCYAENFPLSFHWNAVTDGRRGVAWEDFLLQVRALPKGQIWRHNQAGDLAGADGVIGAVALRQLVKANKGKRGFLYTHYPMTAPNRRAVKAANKAGLTINLSADNLSQADEYLALGVGPVAVVVPEGWNGATPAGNKVTVCPAQRMEHMTCAVCQLCQKADRHAIVAFEAHGGRKRAVMKIIQLEKEPQ